MKVLVAYLTKTGNTKKVAEAIYEGIEGEKELKPIGEVDSIEGYDLAFLGFPVEREGASKKALRLLAKHCVDGRKVALFITHAAPEEAVELPAVLEKFRQAASGADIVAVFDCQGQLAKGVKFIMSIMPDPKLRRWARLDNSQGQPDASRLERARAFAAGVMEKQSAAELVLV